MDESLSKALAKRFVAEISESESVVRRGIAIRSLKCAPTKKGARKAVSVITAMFNGSFIDYATYDDDSILRFCTATGPVDAVTDRAGEIVLTLQTIDIDPKKQIRKKLGVDVTFSLHALQRTFQRVKFVVPADAKRLNYSPIVNNLRDANLWCQTVLNAMRVGKVLGGAEANVNLIIPTRDGAFVGLFSADMSAIHLRSFLGPTHLGVRLPIWERCRDIIAETGMDLHWVSNTNFKDPKVVAAFVLAEEAGVFNINWNRTNTAKETAIDLNVAGELLRTRANSGKTIRKGQPDDTYF